jgi:signal transduction histidine kinase
VVRTLFGKILLWSVLIQLLSVGTVLALATYYLPESQEAIDNAFQLYADTTVTLYERFGPQAVDDFLARSGQNTLLQLKLSASEPGTDCGRHTDEEIGFLARGQNGAYCLTVRAKRGELPSGPDDWRPRLRVLLIVELLSCPAFSYVIARYLSRPISELRRAAGRLAKGDLSARIGPRFSRRRDEAAELVREFDQMADRVAALIQAQRRLIGDVSHEIKSPLARLSVALGLAQRDAGDRATRQFERMEREVDSISRLVGELLTLARLDAASAHLPDERFELGETIADVVADLAFESPERAPDLAFTRPDQPVVVRGDRALLGRAINNVVRNAVFYTTPGGAIAITCATDNGRVRITIADQGPGVPEPALPHLFDPFYRVDDARTRRTGGTGIGLAICRGAVTLHGGTVTAANVAPHGLAVVIDLPQVPTDTESGQDSTQLHKTLS